VPLLMLAAALAMAGCATAPSGGPPRQAPGGSHQVQAYAQELSGPGPTSTWIPQDVVLGFLHASASYAVDPTAARQYLVPRLRRHWHPGEEPVAVVGTPTSFVETVPEQGPVPSSVATVKFTGQHLATLSQTGQYQYAPGQNTKYTFVLAKTDGVWLIQTLPQQQQLLLTQSDFEDVYQLRNLFFFAPPGAGQAPSQLVPDPVYAPLVSSNSALNTDLATGLVNGLLKGEGGWLSGATVSAFPRGTTLLRKVTITGKTARVDLGGAAARAQPITVQAMAAQILATLNDGEYSLPLANQIELYINNRLDTVPVPQIAGLVPSVATGPVLLVSGGGVGELSAVPKPGMKPQTKLTQAQVGQASISAVAASPDLDRTGQFAVAVPDGTGCTVQVRSGSPSSYQSYPLPGSAAPCTSLSYDANGNLWAAAGSGVWLLQPNRGPVAVDLSATEPAGPILALRVAPDAVRAALLVQTPAGNELLLEAVQVRGGTASFGQPVTVGAGLTDPAAISWYDAYHLAALAGGGIYDVPLTGGAGQQPGATPYLFSTAPQDADSLTTDGSEFVVATTSGQVWAGVSSLSLVTTGTDPIYPG
jgi:hypothetical protein